MSTNVPAGRWTGLAVVIAVAATLGQLAPAPWQIAVADIKVRIANPKLHTAHVLDANGMTTASLPLTDEAGKKSFHFPEDALYVVLD